MNTTLNMLLSEYFCNKCKNILLFLPKKVLLFIDKDSFHFSNKTGMLVGSCTKVMVLIYGEYFSQTAVPGL